MKNYVVTKCDCGCSVFVVEKLDNEFILSIQDSYIHNGQQNILGRIRKALKVLLGKPIYYADIYIDSSGKMKELTDNIYKLIESGD